MIANLAANVYVIHGDVECLTNGCDEEAVVGMEVALVDSEVITVACCREHAHDFLDLIIDKGEAG